MLGLAIFIIAPAHPHATLVAVYPALFYKPPEPGVSYIAFLSTIQYRYNTFKYWDNTILYQYNTISMKIVYNTLSWHTKNIYIPTYSFNDKYYV